MTPKNREQLFVHYWKLPFTTHNFIDHRNFEKGISGISQIMMALKVSDRFDYLLGVTTKDMQSLNALSDTLLEGALGISKLVTIPILEVAKPFSGFPIQQL